MSSPIDGKKIETREELDHSLDEMIASSGAYLLETVVEKEDNVFPMVPTGASVSEILLS